MSAVAVANNILDHILKQGKDVMHEKFLKSEKVPPFATNSSHHYQVETVVQVGHQVAAPRNNYLALTAEKQPTSLPKDQFCSRGSIHKKLVQRSAQASPDKAKGNKRSFSYSAIKNNKIKSGGFSASKAKAQQKQNQFIKLNDNNGRRIVVEKAVQRESMEEDRLREHKKAAIIKEYEQKKAVEMFERDRYENKQTKQKQFEEHTSRGHSHKFIYHEGELLLFKEELADLQRMVPRTPHYYLQEDFSTPASTEQAPSHQYFQRKATRQNSAHPTNASEHHRIRSARGQAFASAVLKTINLSRISMNETLRNLEDDQFMKRNDLFNNNHSRQTSSIPYLLPKSGTVYTELSTNQVVENKSQTERKASCSFKSETTRNPITSKPMSHFEPFLMRDASCGDRSERDGHGQEAGGRQQVAKPGERPVRTAEAGRRRALTSERRPHSSTNKGRITTANGELFLSLLQ